MIQKKENKSIIYYGQVVCPRCDGNGLIYQTYVLLLGVTIYLCDECEAMWEDPKTISISNFRDFTTYLQGHGVTYIDAELQDIDYEWHKR